MARTLITAASTAQAYRLQKQLDGTPVLLGDYTDLPEIMVKSGKMIKLPVPQDDTYPHQMLGLCLDYEVNTVYLLREQEAHALMQATQLFAEYGITLKLVHD
jgi:hypothetical protein